MADMALDLSDPVALTAALVDIESVSGNEGAIATAVYDVLQGLAHLDVERIGNNVVARTALGRARRVLLAGHLDTVPIADNLPSRREGDVLHGCGTSDMKSGVAVILHLAQSLRDPAYDLTFVLYDNEEVEADKNGLNHLVRDHRAWFDADLAILMEPTNVQVEAGCQGTLRVRIDLHGTRAHSARSWLGVNAIHAAAPVLQRLADHVSRDVDIDGCIYREGLQAVAVQGGVAGNVVPDEASVTVNFRFAPDRSEADAFAYVQRVFEGFEVTLVDSAAGALPGLTQPAAQAFIAAVGRTPLAKYGWTDVSRFSALGIPALNYGPGDPNLAHTREEHVDLRQVTEAAELLRGYLS